MDSALLEKLDGMVQVFLVNDKASAVRLWRGKKILSFSVLKVSNQEEVLKDFNISFPPARPNSFTSTYARFNS